MLVLVTREHFDPPAAVEVEAVVRGEGPRRRWHYARATITPWTHDGSGTPEQVVIRRRSGKRWKVPRHGREREVLVWRDPDPSGASFAEPSSGAGLFVLLDGSLSEQGLQWSASRAGRTAARWEYFRVYSGSAETGRPRGLGRTDPDGPRWNCQMLGRSGWVESEYLARYHVIGTNEDEYVALTEDEARQVVADLVSQGRVPPTEL